MVKKILITGINGFLGSHLAKMLCDKYEIIGLTNNKNNLHRINSFNFKIYSSKDSLEEIFQENIFFSIIHAATVYRRSDEDRLDSLINTNVLLPIKLIQLANHNDVKLFINTDTFFNTPSVKHDYLQDYTLSKKNALEWLMLISNDVKKCKLVNLKIFHMYGNEDSITKFIPSIVSKINNKEAHISLTKGEQTRDFIYIDDVVAAYAIVLNNIDKLELFTEFEVGTGIETSIRSLVSLMVKISKNNITKLKFGEIQYKNNEIMQSKANNLKLCELGWEINYNLEKGLMNLFSQ